LRHSRRTPMLLAAVVMCISSWIGTLAGLSGIGAVLACTIWGFLYGTVWTLARARRGSPCKALCGS
jgi:hypothetical protein